MDKKESKKSFVFNCEWREVLRDFPAEVRLEVYDAIIEYAASGTLTELKPLARMAFLFMKGEVDRNRSKYEEVSRKRGEAGRKGMSARYGNEAEPGGRAAREEAPRGEVDVEGVDLTNANKTNKPQQTVTNLTYNDNDNDEDDIKKEKREKEKPAKLHYAPCVMMTGEEYRKLAEAHGEDGAAWMVRKLDDYKAASGKTYKSDYRAILNWVVGEWQKQVERKLEGNGNGEGDYVSRQEREKRLRDEEFRRHIEEKLRGVD